MTREYKLDHLLLNMPRLMGIVNITDDSFSDGGSYLDADKAYAHAEKLINEGAEIIDLGGESTRPGSRAVPEDIELQRVVPVLEKIRATYPAIDISVDTRQLSVARAAISLGAKIINDISALRYDAELARLIADHQDVKIVLMHMQGDPSNMQDNPKYEDVLEEVSAFLSERADYALREGVRHKQIILDPGIGFGKNIEHNLTLLSNLDRFRKLGFPLLVGASRKRFIAAIDSSGVNDRLGGSIATAYACACQQVDILRVHDVRAHRQFFQVLNSIARGRI